MSLPRWSLSFFAAYLCTSWAVAQPAQPQNHSAPKIAGWIETVTFPDYEISFDAELDTGADFSSLGVNGLVRFKRNGKTWYRFTVTDKNGRTVAIEQQTKRIARIQRAEVADTLRPIVRLKICVAGQIAETDFSLTDRSGQSYAVLIGRRFLAPHAILVDSRRAGLFPKPCESGK